MDTWLVEELYRDDLQELDTFGGGQSGQGIYLGILCPQNLLDGEGAEGT